ncbi:2-phosphosulfolactate phosphatase [Erwinia sp. MMLR14_017]|uniref:2-phosphosulfolactate phosphatase n=1 Tax=Erwinia sp. MMLR14_017 TaxID=3093842 RepID=UPI00299077C3|nr:2-phosphosulfolactate phosphatase [Erwinia sp. MMLR14_017]MDW8845078.1 2-phosphosulfolactate phosphatase [Erwinia sp. MMLR14_017]
MEWFSQNGFEVRLEWGLSAVEYLASEADCAVIVDVMSFSTCVSLAVDNGARIYPYPWKDQSALEYGMRIGANTASFDRRFSGTGYSLSPASIRSIRAGESLVLPSPNGSAISFRARDSGISVFSGCFRNMTATAKACREFKRILVIPCGERWPDNSLRPSIEDYAAAGGIIAALDRYNISPEAHAAVAAYQYHKQHSLSLLHQCSSAMELRQRGFEEDITLCLDAEVSEMECLLHGDFYGSGQG